MKYNEFIQNIIDTRGQWNIYGYHEKHHIVPKCLGGLPKYVGKYCKHSNIIWLTAEEHFIAHKLLAKENQNNKAIRNAFWHMCTSNSGKQFLTAEEYAKARLNRHLEMSGVGNPFYGKQHSEATKKLLSEKASLNIGRPGTNNREVVCLNTNIKYNSIKEAAIATKTSSAAICGCIKEHGGAKRAAGYYWAYADDIDLELKLSKYFGKEQNFSDTPETHERKIQASRGRRWTAESKAKLSRSKLGHAVSAETRQKISNKHIGKKLTEATKEKLRKAGIGRPGTNNKKIKCIETGAIFNSIVEASNLLKISRSTIYKMLANNNYSYNGIHLVLGD